MKIKLSVVVPSIDQKDLDNFFYFDVFSLLITHKSMNICRNEKIIAPMERGGNFVSDNVIFICRKRVFL